MLLVTAVCVSPAASAAEAPVGLGTVGAYSVLGGETVTNTGPSLLGRNVGVSPGTAITGFPPGTSAGETHAADAPAGQAQSDLLTAYNDAAGRAVTANVAADLVGRTLTAGVYKAPDALALTGSLTLDGQGDPNAVFIFQATSTLITASASSVNVINGAQGCNVFWQVGSSATLGTGSTFLGTVLAQTSISVQTNVTVQGRALAHTGAVTLDNDTFTSPDCAAPAVPATASPTSTPTASAAASPTAKASARAKAREKAKRAARRAAHRSAAPGTGNGPGAPSAGPELPHTGPASPISPMFGSALLLLVTGGLLVTASRHRRYRRKH